VKEKVRRLSERAAKHALAKFQDLHESLREHYACTGATWMIADLPFVGVVVEEPILSWTDVYCPLVAPELVHDPALVGVLLEARQEIWNAKRVILRLPTQTRDPGDPRLRRLAQYLHKEARRHDEPASVEIVPVTPNTQEFVHGLLAKAILNGYRDSALDFDRALEYVRATYTLGQEERASSLVAIDGGRAVGHITWTEATDDVTSREITEIVDVYVLEDREGTGISKQLTQALENRLAGGRTLRGNVISDDPGAGRVAAGLASWGWRFVFDLWVNGDPVPASHGIS